MTMLETTAVVPDDRRLVLQLPDAISPGEHRIRVEIDPPLAAECPVNETTPVAWDGEVLVYAGQGVFSGDICQLIDDDRDERIRQIVVGVVR